MARKVFYKYNPNTLSYERIYPSVGARIFSVCKYLLLSILIGIGFFLVFYQFFESPREKKLREDNEQMATQYRILSHRLDEALEVMGDVQQRDNNLYRIIMQANPIDSKTRNAGIDNDSHYKELQNLANADLIVSSTKKARPFAPAALCTKHLIQ